MLTDQEIDNLCSEWLYVAPGRTYEEHRPFARAIESAATAPLLARIAELERELEEASKDAERYRHLCSSGGQRTELCFDGGHYFGKADFDAAIDAAIKEQT